MEPQPRRLVRHPPPTRFLTSQRSSLLARLLRPQWWNRTHGRPPRSQLRFQTPLCRATSLRSRSPVHLSSARNAWPTKHGPTKHGPTKHGPTKDRRRKDGPKSDRLQPSRPRRKRARKNLDRTRRTLRLRAAVRRTSRSPTRPLHAWNLPYLRWTLEPSRENLFSP